MPNIVRYVVLWSSFAVRPFSLLHAMKLVYKVLSTFLSVLFNVCRERQKTSDDDDCDDGNGDETFCSYTLVLSANGFLGGKGGGG